MIPRPNIRDVVSVERLGLDAVRREEGGISVGAAVTLSRLDTALDASSPAERLLRMTIRRTATTPLRNLMTVGGVIGGMGPWSDLPVALLALEADIVMNGESVVSMAQCAALGPRKLPGEVITEVRVRCAGVHGGAFIKVGRNETDLAMASAAVVRRDGVAPPRAAIGGVVARPVRLAAVEDCLRARSPSREELIGLIGSGLLPRSDPRASGEYRVALAAACVLDCYALCCGEALR